MDTCPHKHLVLLNAARERVRCRVCHLTIAEIDLDGGYCPECYETRGVRQYDFDPVSPQTEDGTTYRCEDCGALVKC